MTNRTCAHCTNKLPTGSAGNRRYCNNDCRRLAENARCNPRPADGVCACGSTFSRTTLKQVNCSKLCRERRAARENYENRKPKMAAYRAANKEKIDATARVWRANNAEARKARRRAAPKKPITEARRAYQAEHYQRNREAALERSRAWRQANRERMNDHSRARRARMRGHGEATALSREAIAARLAYFGNRCWMCGGVGTEVDHVKPIDKGGPHLAANIRPSCRTCNGWKSARWFGVASLHKFIREGAKP